MCAGALKGKSPQVIFFYTGNEANVELYVNATGLMWENAAEFGAVLVFAEHRFYGKSTPEPVAVRSWAAICPCMWKLSQRT